MDDTRFDQMARGLDSRLTRRRAGGLAARLRLPRQRRDPTRDLVAPAPAVVVQRRDRPGHVAGGRGPAPLRRADPPPGRGRPLARSGIGLAAVPGGGQRTGHRGGHHCQPQPGGGRGCGRNVRPGRGRGGDGGGDGGRRQWVGGVAAAGGEQGDEQGQAEQAVDGQQHLVDPRYMLKSCCIPVFEPRNHQEMHEAARIAACPLQIACICGIHTYQS